jgi:hypothetical protein
LAEQSELRWPDDSTILFEVAVAGIPIHAIGPLNLACPLFGVARFGCGALLLPDTLLWVTIFGFFEGWEE